MEKYSIDARDFVFMYSGRIDETKGVLQLIKAFKKIDIKNKKLIIVGERWFGEKSGIDDYLKQIYGQVYEIGEKIVFTGFVCPKDMPTYYSICDCIVIPSMCEETFGMVALEGMAAGKPLIITNSGGMMEVVDEKCAIIIEKEKIVDELPRAMLNMIKKHETFRNMGEYGKQRVKSMECFNEQRYLENFYSKIK